jgi:hypothetical protein
MAIALRAALSTAVVAGLAVGCQLDLSYDDAAFRCVEGGCPTGLTCVEDRCVAPDVVDGPACASAAFLHGFDDPALPEWEQWFEDGFFTAGDGGLSLTMTAADGDGYVELNSHDAFDLRDGQLELDVGDPGLVGVWLLARQPGGGAVAEIGKDGDALLFTLKGDPGLGAGPDVSTRHDPAAHRYWRLAGADGLLTWATSPDRASWTVQREEAMPDGLGVSGVRLGAWHDGPAEARLGSLNPEAPELRWCGPDELTSRFDDDLAPIWRRFSSDTCTVAVFDGELNFTLAGDDQWCAIRPRRPIDLRNAAVSFQVQQLEAFTRFEIEAGDEELVIQASPDSGVRVARNGDKVTDDVPYAEASWWRVAATGDALTFEISTDGVSYRAIARMTAVSGLEEARLELAVSGSSLGALVKIDDFNLPPR